jgi:hypothetical protein
MWNVKGCVQKATLAKSLPGQVLGNSLSRGRGEQAKASHRDPPFRHPLTRADHVIEQLVDVRFWHKADIPTRFVNVCFRW